MKYKYPTKEWLEKEWLHTNKTMRQIANELNLPYKSLENVARVKYRLTKKYSYTIDETFFKIENDNFQYFLGLLYADGNTYKTQGVVLEQEDRQIMVDIKEAMKYTGTLYTYTTPTNYRYRLHITNKKLRKLVGEYGMEPNKTSTIRLPKLKNYSHFMRGFFDGDGSVRKNAIVVTWYCHSPQFNVDVVDMLSTIGINTLPHSWGGKSGTYISLTRAQSRVFLDWIYADKDLHMVRKHNIYLKHIS